MNTVRILIRAVAIQPCLGGVAAVDKTQPSMKAGTAQFKELLSETVVQVVSGAAAAELPAASHGAARRAASDST